jgi:hypothetical protein
MKPLTVTDYKGIMGAELADWHLSNYPVPRKQGKKYKKKTFFFGTLWKSCVLHCYMGDRKTPLQYSLHVMQTTVERF